MRTRILVVLVAAVLVSTAACDPNNPYARGPAPTVASIEATTGPFEYATLVVPDSATPGFGAATIYYPTYTGAGTFGAVAIAPGFTESQSVVSWFGPRLSSQGFVVITFNTNSSFDSPASRGTQLLAALDYLANTSDVRTHVDGSRTAVMGHSMGGGGSLEAAKARTNVQAAIPLAAWNNDKTWPEIQTPTLVVGAQNDSVAPVNSHSKPFYDSMPAELSKGYLELAGAGHSVTNSPNTTTAKYVISWLKRFVDNDTRYQQFLCPPPPVGGTVSAYLATCPYP